MSAQPILKTSAPEILPTLDLSAVTERVIAEHNLTAEQAERGEQWYRMFLSLRQSHASTSIAPPALADKWWHEHITLTRKYFTDCEALFGSYLHHEPSSNELENQRAKRNAIALYQSEFGADLTLVKAADCQ